jgi:hypothetical protein
VKAKIAVDRQHVYSTDLVEQDAEIIAGLVSNTLAFGIGEMGFKRNFESVRHIALLLA